jgi:phage baseplate assembly protein W
MTVLQYGQDLSATKRLNYGRTVSSGELLAEAAYRRLITVRGTLLDDPNYGLGLVRWLQTEYTPAMLAALPAIIRLELMKDPRLDSVNVEITSTRDASSAVAMQVEITGAGVNGEGFSLVLAVSDVTVDLLELKGE